MVPPSCSTDTVSMNMSLASGMSSVVYCVLCTRYQVCRALGIRSVVYWVLGHWVLGPYALDTTSRATAQNLAKTCSTPSLFGIPACIIQSRLFTSSKHYSLKSRWNVYYPLVTCLLGAHALLYPCENIHQNQTQVFGPKCIILNIRPNTTNAKRANSAMRLARKNFRIHMSQTVTC